MDIIQGSLVPHILAEIVLESSGEKDLCTCNKQICNCVCLKCNSRKHFENKGSNSKQDTVYI